MLPLCASDAFQLLQATGDTAVEDNQRANLRLLLPSALCGVLIGKGGATIRSFSQVGLSDSRQTLELAWFAQLQC